MICLFTHPFRSLKLIFISLTLFGGRRVDLFVIIFINLPRMWEIIKRTLQIQELIGIINQNITENKIQVTVSNLAKVH
jgi:hypothetical protein